MNSKHLESGSLCPPLVNGKLRMYNMRYCPYAQRSVLVALAKQIPLDVVNCNLISKPEWLLKKNPNGKVPTIELSDGRILYESLIVADYLDETNKNRLLSSNDPFQKALDKVWIEEFNKVIGVFNKMLLAIKVKEQESLKGLLKDFQVVLGPFEKELRRRGTKFFADNNLPGMLDYMIWPWFERLSFIKSVATIDIFDFEAAKKDHPKLESWRQAMKDDFAVKAYVISPEIHKEFIEAYLNGKTNYDLME